MRSTSRAPSVVQVATPSSQAIPSNFDLNCIRVSQQRRGCNNFFFLAMKFLCMAVYIEHASAPLLIAHFIYCQHIMSTNNTMNARRPNFSAGLYQKHLAALGERHWLPPRVTNENALICLSTSANALNPAEFGFVMSYIVRNAQSIFDRSDFSIIVHDYALISRAITWIITEFDLFAREIEEEEQAKAVAFIARALDGHGHGDGDGDDL
eukprot:scaffold6874_cov74-Skeletonema_dohrnii-CCMP3373.AAC.2